MADKIADENYKTQQHKAGLVKVAAWVPEAMREEFLEIAREMCSEVGVTRKRKPRRLRKKTS